ncbi:MAG: gamma-butyrobetaine hydroxylase-like domain-containing protein [Alphaproteobacteria bacterium]
MADAGEAGAWPVEITLDPSKLWLTVAYDDGATFRLPAELLRVESPSAEVQGHGGDQKTIVPGKRSVTIRSLEPVGNYAVRIAFSDGHDTGLYTWRYLRELGKDQRRLWQGYLDALAARGLSR